MIKVGDRVERVIHNHVDGPDVGSLGKVLEITDSGHRLLVRWDDDVLTWSAQEFTRLVGGMIDG